MVATWHYTHATFALAAHPQVLLLLLQHPLLVLTPAQFRPIVNCCLHHLLIFYLCLCQITVLNAGLPTSYQVQLVRLQLAKSIVYFSFFCLLLQEGLLLKFLLAAVVVEARKAQFVKAVGEVIALAFTFGEQ